MSENDANAAKRSLTVLPHSGKVDQLRSDTASVSQPPPTNRSDANVISRFVDPTKTTQQKLLESKIVGALQTIYDPEIPVNIYDLGLIYEINIHPETSHVDVKMTLTAPGCPVAGELIAQVQKKIEAIAEVPGADVQLVWDPPWTRALMSEAARLDLGL